MEKLKNALLLLLLALFATALIFFPAEAAEAAREGLSLCFRTVLPSLFPFFVLSSLAVSSGVGGALARVFEPFMRPLFGLSGAGASALALGLIGGYPVGARTTAELYRRGSVSRAEAERLLSFCNNAGPGFILGICGGAVFQNTRAGLYLYLVHIAAALPAGALLCRVKAKDLSSDAPLRHAAKTRKNTAAAFPAAVRESFFAVWSVCGFVVLFMVLLRLLTLLLPAHPLLLGFVELTNGVLSLTADRSGFVLCAALLGWGGLSVHAQTLSVLDETDLSARWYFLGKITQAALSVPLAMLAAKRLF